jgi:hypothetical protein
VLRLGRERFCNFGVGKNFSTAGRLRGRVSASVCETFLLWPLKRVVNLFEFLITTAANAASSIATLATNSGLSRINFQNISIVDLGADLLLAIRISIGGIE